jgi:hypothetical protein
MCCSNFKFDDKKQNLSEKSVIQPENKPLLRKLEGCAPSQPPNGKLLTALSMNFIEKMLVREEEQNRVLRSW